MKHPSEKLFRLISSLTTAEKRYFGKYASLHVRKGKNIYLRLFEEIDKQQEYDEARIRKKFRGETFVRQLTATKYYLYNLILKSLRAYYHEESGYAKLHDMIRNIELLYKKGLIAECVEQIGKAKKLAEKLEYFPELMAVLNWEIELNYAKANLERVSEVMDEKNAVMEKESNYTDVDHICARVTRQYKSMNIVRTEKDRQLLYETIEAPLEEMKKDLQSYRARDRYYKALGIYHTLINDTENIVDTMRSNVAVIEEDPAIAEENHLNYAITLINFVVAADIHVEEREMNHYLDKLEQVSSKIIAPGRQLYLQLFRFIHLLNYYCHIGNVKRGQEEIVKIEQELDINDPLIAPHQRAVLLYNMGVIFLMDGRFNQALHYMNRSVDCGEPDEVGDVAVYSRVLNLIIHFELGNMLFFPYLYRSTYRYLAKRKRLYKFETLLMKYMKKASGITNRKEELISVLKGFRKDMLQIAEESTEVVVFKKYFDFISWTGYKLLQLEGKKNITMAEVVKNRIAI